LEIGKKKFSTSSMACGNFWQKPENAFFWSSLKITAAYYACDKRFVIYVIHMFSAGLIKIDI
jgi:hypothetical protein